jgi:hypothetical protein
MGWALGVCGEDNFLSSPSFPFFAFSNSHAIREHALISRDFAENDFPCVCA